MTKLRKFVVLGRLVKNNTLTAGPRVSDDLSHLQQNKTHTESSTSWEYRVYKIKFHVTPRAVSSYMCALEKI
jgi:hypothetical protein